MTDLIVAGAGMAGLAAAATATALGANVVCHERLNRPGGSMLLSSGVIWRHLELEDFRRECPDGDPELQRLVHERLDRDLEWLDTEVVPAMTMTTDNPRTTGARFDTQRLADALAARAGELRLGEPLTELPDGTPVVLATGGFVADRELVEEHVTPEAGETMLRASPGGVGDGLRLGLGAGGRATGLSEVYGRNMPAPPARVLPDRFVAAGQLYADVARIENADGETYECGTWSQIDVLQWTARQPRARAWLTVPEEALGELRGIRTIGEMVTAAEVAGAPVERAEGKVRVETVAGLTTTLGGLAVGGDCRLEGVAEPVFAAGQDTGGVANGGYASGLAAALVMGRRAAEAALGVERDG